MIKFEHTEVYGWEAAIRGMRNPLNSWAKSDSDFGCNNTLCVNCGFKPDWCGNTFTYIIGPNDQDLMMRLRNAGTDHRKFMRMINVTVDITAPTFWWAEMDTYKIGTVRNSCSFMHKGVNKPFEIQDFSFHDERVYDVLCPLEKKNYELRYPYETETYKRWQGTNGRTYRVYPNGRVIREAFGYVDPYGSGRARYFEEAPATMYKTTGGYFVVALSGRGNDRILLHRLVASLFVPNSDPLSKIYVNHIDGDKGNNSAENLEWVTFQENIDHANQTNLFENVSSMHSKYLRWKNACTLLPIEKRGEFLIDCRNGMTHTELGKKYGITPTQANNVRSSMRKNDNDNEILFQYCYTWERIITTLNNMRELYLETKDQKVFHQIRCLLPMGYMYRSTVQLNYEVLANIYKSRKNHKLDEWSVGFVQWIETLPFSELITGEKKGE